MLRKTALALAVLLLLFGGTRPAEASGEVSVYRWDLSALDGPGLGGFFTGILIGPGGGTVVNTRIIMEFATTDAWDASGLELGVVGSIEQPDGTIGARLDLTGADFGWFGVGYFDVVYETEALNGPIIGLPGAPTSPWSMHLNDPGNFYFGQLMKLRIELDVVDLYADARCPGDLDGDAELGPSDLQYFDLGPCPDEGECPADINGDGIVTQADRDILIRLFGNVCPVAP